MVTVNKVGVDITKDLQAIANNPAVSEILFCGNRTGSVFTVNGTVNIPATTVLKFDNGNKISGTGTINGGIIEANHHFQIFDTSLTVNPTKTSDSIFSVKWYGAGNSGRDDIIAITKAIQACYVSTIDTVYFPTGNYTISKSI